MKQSLKQVRSSLDSCSAALEKAQSTCSSLESQLCQAETSHQVGSLQLQLQLEKQFNLMKDEYLSFSCQKEKQIALLEQEKALVSAENHTLRGKIGELQAEVEGLREEVGTLGFQVEKGKKETVEREEQKGREVAALRNEFEKKIEEVRDI